MLFAPGIFSGRTALVTGGGTGIGRACALLLARLGARVAIGSRNPDNLAPTVDELRAIAGAAHVHHGVCDIREPDEIAKLVTEIVDKLGAIDLLINNAGGQFVSPAVGVSPKGFDAVVRNNLSGTFFVTREVAARCMIPAKRGAIVNVIAQIQRGFPGMVHTGAARAGVENMTKTLAIEWAEFKINVNAVAPGVIRTSGTDKYPPELLEMARQRTPAKRLGSAEEVADAIAYLLSPAARFVTGETLYIDGGAHLWGDNWPIPEH